MGEKPAVDDTNGRAALNGDGPNNGPESEVYVRETWSNKIQFLLGCVAFSVGLGNVWRFPYLCYKYGGGAFLVPYFISVAIGAIPMFMMEIAMGQYTGQGVITAWNLVPIFKGIGYAIQVVIFLQVVCYNVIMGWALHYLFASFTTVLPWSTCGNAWNSELCRKDIYAYSRFGENVTEFARNASSTPGGRQEGFLEEIKGVLGRNVTEVDLMIISGSVKAMDPVTEYWHAPVGEQAGFLAEIWGTLGRNVTEVDLMIISGSAKAVDLVTEYWQTKVLAISDGVYHLGGVKWDLALCVLLACLPTKVLAISDGVDQLGGVKWDLALCVLLAWVLVYFCIWKGIKWTGKIMYVTTTSPYVFMVILLIRGLTLPGAIDGLKFYMYPDLSKMSDLMVWYEAAAQVFYSYSMCCASLTALGSYNKFYHNFWKDSILFAIINSGTSLLAGLVIFAILGYMSHEQQVSVDMVAESGPGLAFIAYPKAVAELPGAPVWSILFFFMLIILGMDSQFGVVEGFVTAIIDMFPRQLRRKGGRELFVLVVCSAAYLIGLPMCTNGGMYVFQIFDYYIQARSVVIIALFECIAIAWVYGAQRFHEHMELMLGRKLWPVLKYCWLYITPAFELVMVALCFIQYSHLKYNRTYEYPLWAIGCGWSMPLFALSLIPVIAIVQIIRAEGTLLERIRFLTIPQIGKRPDAEDIEEVKDNKNPVTLQLLTTKEC